MCNFDYMANFEKRYKFFQKVYITDTMRNIAKDFSSKIVNEKMKETEYIKDCNKIITRYTTGIIGEMAVLKLLGIDYRNVNIDIGNTKYFQFADLQEFGYNNVGIKTVEYGKAPVVFKNNRDHQIIVVIKGNYAIVCGIATPRVLDTYSTPELILDKNLRAKGNKVGFYGFNHLFTIRNKKELDSFLNSRQRKVS